MNLRSKQCDNKATHPPHGWWEHTIKSKRQLMSCAGHVHKHKLKISTMWFFKIGFECIDEEYLDCSHRVVYSKAWIRARLRGEPIPESKFSRERRVRSARRGYFETHPSDEGIESGARVEA